MSDYELLTLVLMMLGIIMSILIAYINHTKSNRPLAEECDYFFVTYSKG